MGKLLDALKKKNIDLNKAGLYKDRYVQDQAKALLLSMLNKLPEEKRRALLDEFLSPGAKERNTKSEYTSMLHDIKKQGKEASRKYLTDDDNFEKGWKNLLKPMEERMRGWTDVHYKEEGIGPDSPPDDKLVTLFNCATFDNRMDFLWDYVSEKRKSEYQRQFLPRLTKDPKTCSRYFNEKGTFAEGKNWEKLAEAIEAGLDEASLNEAAESVEAFRGPDLKATVESLRKSVDRHWSDTKDRLHFLMQNAMLTPDAELDPEELREKVNSSKWEQNLNPANKAEQLGREGKLNLGEIIERSKRIISEAGTKEDTLICKEAALKNYRMIKHALPAQQHGGEAFKEMDRHASALQADVVRAKYEGNAKNLDEGRGMISEQIAMIEKEKDGFLLSKTNSPEHDHMTKSLRFFNAKLDMVLGKETAQKLSAEELEAVKNADIKALYDKAKEATFQYSCKKTKFGKGSILHEDGRARNRAARNTFELLSQMGGLLGLSDAAARMKEETALDVLENRGSKEWEKTNAEDCAAKTIYALSMMHGNMSDGKQEGMLSESAMNRNLKKIKQRPEFRQMVKDLGPAGLCEAIVKGDDTLTLAYANAAKKLKDPQAGKGKPVVEMTAEQQREFWAKESQEPGEAKKQNPATEDIPIK